MPRGASHRPMKRGKPERRKLMLPERLDIAAVRKLAPLIRSRGGRLLGAIGNVGDEPPLLLLSGSVAAIGLARRDRKLARTGLSMIAAHALAIAMKTYGKNHVDRSRPRQLLEDGTYERRLGRSRADRLRSFPSGHTAGAVAIARTWGRSYPRQALLAEIVAGTIGALQVPRRAHWPTDVLAGALLGIVSDVATHAASAGLKRLLRGPSAAS